MVGLLGVAVLSWLAGNVGRLPGVGVGSAPSALTFLDLLLIPLWFRLLMGWRMGTRPWPEGPVVRWLMRFIVVAVLSLCAAAVRWRLSMMELLTATSYLGRWVAYAGWYVLLVTDRPREGNHQAWTGLERALLGFALFGIVQSAFLPGFAQMVHRADTLAWDQQGHRLVSTVLDPNFAGTLLVLGLTLRAARRGMGEPLALGWDVLLGGALVLTLSRSALLALVAALGIVTLVSGIGWRGIRRALLIALAATPAVPAVLRFADQFGKLGVDVSGLQRLVSWMQGWQMFLAHPIVGVGFNAVGPARRAMGFSRIGTWSSLEGGILTVAAMTGVLGVFTFGACWVAFGREARAVWRAANATRGERAEALGTWAASVAVLVQSFFVNALFLPFVTFPLWVLWGRVHQTARRVGVGSLVLAMVSLLSACEPCAGLAGCDAPVIRVVEGTILNRETRKPQRDVEVIVGAISTWTNAQGQWRVALPELPDSILDITIRASPTERYTVPQVRIRPRTRVGEAEDLGTWFDRPLVRHTFRLTYRGVPLSNAETEFRPAGQGGDSVLRATASPFGYVQLVGRPGQVGPLSDAFRGFDVPGEFRVRHPALGERRFAGVTMYADYRVEFPVVRGWGDFEASRPMVYTGEVLDRRLDFLKVGGASVVFRRTGGVRVYPEVFSAVTESVSPFIGRFTLRFESEEPGVAYGDLTVTTPDGTQRQTYAGVALTVRDTNTSRALGVFPVAHMWIYAIEAWRRDLYRPDPGVPFRFERLSGPALTPSVWTGVTDGGGRIWLKAQYSDTGTVVGRWILSPPGRPVDTLTFTLPTFAENEPRFAGTHPYGPALWYTVTVKDSANRPVANADVSWRRTGGLVVDPADGSGRTDADGRVYLARMAVPAAGNVVLELTVRPGGLWGSGRTFVFPGVSLPTHLTEEWNSAGVFRIPTP